jgi:hypothetical protein
MFDGTAPAIRAFSLIDRRWSYLFAVPVFALLLFSHDPRVILRASFYAEDAALWYPDAYRAGWHALLWPVVGYLQTFPRLIALATLPFPLHWAPTLFALAAFVVQILVALFLISPRMQEAWPSPSGRLLFALIYLSLPNSHETYVNLTNAQWHLCLLAFLVLVSTPPVSRGAFLFDSTALLACGLTGPFTILLAPIALWEAWPSHAARRAVLFRAGTVLACASIQACVLLFGHFEGRSEAPLGATPELLARILAYQVFIGALIGQRGVFWLERQPVLSMPIVAILVAVVGVSLWTLAVLRGPAILRQGTLLACLILLGALARPQVSMTAPQWPLLTVPGAGCRYWLVPMLAWIGALLALATAERGRSAGRAVAALILILPMGIAGDWAFPDWIPTHFIAQARAFEAAPTGTRMILDARPKGWKLKLTKE